MIIDELNEKISLKRENEASFKEQIFYDYLDRQDTKLILQESSSAIDRICYAAFFPSDNQVSDLVKKEQKASPIRGMHYSKNLVELIAMARLDFANEKENLHQYLLNATLKDVFIINKVFPEISISNEYKISDAIDKLVEKVFLKYEYDNIGEFVFEALREASDLIDLFVVKASVQQAWSLHPNSSLKKDISNLILLHQKLSNYYEKRQKTLYHFILLMVGWVVTFFIIKLWERFNLEPYFVAIPILIGIIFFIWKRPNLKKAFDDFIQKRVENNYHRIGVLKSRLDKIKEHYENLKE